jgi:hypothetical protein
VPCPHFQDPIDTNRLFLLCINVQWNGKLKNTDFHLYLEDINPELPKAFQISKENFSELKAFHISIERK